MRLALVLIAALVVAGCADRDRVVRAPLAGTSLLVTVYPKGENTGPINTHTVSCPGDDACSRLRAADLAPPPANQPCTKIYGGPAEASVKGSLKGRGIKASFSLTSGCEIDRWRQASYLLGDPPGQ